MQICHSFQLMCVCVCVCVCGGGGGGGGFPHPNFIKITIIVDVSNGVNVRFTVYFECITIFRFYCNFWIHNLVIKCRKFILGSVYVQRTASKGH